MARPREFDADEALDKAMHQFWAKGYHDTSIRDLVNRTGVNYYGLYEVFDSKHGLFLAALDRYCGTVTTEVLAEVRKPGPLRAVLQGAFDHLLGVLKTPDGRVGCMMCNAAVEVAPADPDAAAKVREHMALLRRVFRKRILEAQKDGDLDTGKDAGALAEFLTTTAYSMGMLLRSGCGDAYIQRQLKTTLSLFD